MKKDFAETLKKLRTLKGMTQQELAEKIFVTRFVVAKWEKAFNLPDIELGSINGLDLSKQFL